MVDVTAQARFPVLEITRKTYGSLFGDLPALMRAAALWAAFVIVLRALAGWTGVAPEQAVESGVGGGALLVFSLSSLGAAAMTWLGISAVAVFWHRRILLGEPEPAVMAPLGGRVLLYLLAWILLGLLGMAVVLAGLPLALLLPGLEWAVFLGGGLLTGFLVARLHLVLPAIAIGDPATNMAASWRMTEGNALRVLGAIFLTALPLTVLAILLALLAAALGLAAGAIGSALQAAFEFLHATLVAGLLSHSYSFFKSAPRAA
ncbi:hypothetical protein SH611_09330 [Geminicoccaceae bacterium 1502E]|nr:hypothetical protein [Geminicoccaceae bacterium 1502E]